MTLRAIIRKIYDQALKAVLPVNLINDALSLKKDILRIHNRTFDLRNCGGVYVFGSGKASLPMAEAVNAILGDRIKSGWVISNCGGGACGRIEILEGCHPVPTEKSVNAAEVLMAKLSNLTPNDFFLYLLSGGSSSLVEKPVPPVKLDEFQDVTRLLLGCGAPIEEMNIVRKHLSLAKGGRLGQLTTAAGVVLVISDVVGDDLEAIGSAPMFCDRSSYRDACGILKKYDVWGRIPSNARTVIEQGIAGKIEETPKEPNPRIEHVLIGSNLKGLMRGKDTAESLGIKTHIITSRLRGEAREAAKMVVSMGEEIALTNNPFSPPVCLLFGGETTVTLGGSGLGGRNQEMCLAAVREIRSRKGMTFLSAGTDGIDGNSNAAGAVIDYRTYERSQGLHLNPDEYLNNNDSHAFLQKTGDLIVTGPTGTNVMDMTILLIKEE
jgi:hydroxypyruvate reductase/glycerate 2-kinase